MVVAGMRRAQKLPIAIPAITPLLRRSDVFAALIGGPACVDIWVAFDWLWVLRLDVDIMGDDVIAVNATGVLEDGTEEESASCLEVRALALRDLTPTYLLGSYVSF
jgi:hypothetical protein